MENTYKFEAIFNNASIGIIIVDSSGNIVLINQFALRKFGYSEDEIKGKKIETLIPRRFKTKHEHHRDQYINHNPHSRPMGTGLDLFASRKDGSEFPVEVSLSSYKTAQDQFTIAFVSDITIRKQSEDDLVKLNEELEQKVNERTLSLKQALEKEKELNELKSRFVTMASHEFRTPLSTILSSVYLVSRYVESEDQPKRDKHIERIISSVNMLTDILNDFLSVGKIEEGKIQVRPMDVDIPELFRTYIGELNPILRKGQTITYVHEGDNVANIDPALLKHVLMNLVSNAVKFSYDNTDINITTNKTPGAFSLTVKDYGIGISDEDKEHLFQRFFRGTNAIAIQGTGLGLHIVSKYAELMNAEISCETELGKGTAFTIVFNQNISPS